MQLQKVSIWIYSTTSKNNQLKKKYQELIKNYFFEVTESANAFSEFLWDCLKIHQNISTKNWALKYIIKIKVIIDLPAHF